MRRSPPISHVSIVQSSLGKLESAFMPDGLMLEIDDISLHVEPGDLAILTDVPTTWGGIDACELTLHGDDIASWPHDVRLRAGLFTTTGRPTSVPGIRTIDLVHRMAASGDASHRQALATDWCDRLGVDREQLCRHLDAGFTPDEGISVELLHLALLRPDVAVIDVVSSPSSVNHSIVDGIAEIRIDQPDIAVVVVTKDPRLIAGLTPDHMTNPVSTDADVGRTHRDEALL